MALNNLLASLFERDLRRLMEEVNLFKDEQDLWRTRGAVLNPAGNLVLHVTGGMNHHIGATLAKNGYIRQRNLEFEQKDVPKTTLLSQLEDLIKLVNNTLTPLSAEELEAEFPAFFDQPNASVQYVLIQLSLHLNYHSGQVNYLRRVLEE